MDYKYNVYQISKQYNDFVSFNDLEKIMPYLYLIAFHRHGKNENKELIFISYSWSV